MTGEQHIIRIGGDTCGAVLDVLFIIHAFAGEKRCIGFAAQRIREFFSDAFTTLQCTSHDTRAARLTVVCCWRCLFIIIFVFVFINPCIVTTSAVAGEG
ncbi:hypothetical protein D3C78_1030530 [compost metagenome]